MKYGILLLGILGTTFWPDTPGCTSYNPLPGSTPATSLSVHVINMTAEMNTVHLFVGGSDTSYEQMLAGDPTAQVTATKGFDCKWDFVCDDAKLFTFKSGPGDGVTSGSLVAFEHVLQDGVDYLCGDRVDVVIFQDPKTDQIVVDYRIISGGADDPDPAPGSQ